MNIAFGTVVTILGLLGWFGQLLTWMHRPTAVKWGMAEAEADVDPVFLADTKGEAAWDSFVLWLLPVAGILLILNHAWWPYFGVTGGAIYVYFAGRSLSTRRVFKQRGIRICKAELDRVYTGAIALWGLAGAGMAIAALRALCT